MKVKGYIRIGHGKTAGGKPNTKLAIAVRPSVVPLVHKGSWSGDTVLPTVAFAIEFDVPDALFAQASEVIATLSVPEDRATIAAEVAEPEAAP